jgi:hypothetical protein
MANVERVPSQEPGDQIRTLGPIRVDSSGETGGAPDVSVAHASPSGPGPMSTTRDPVSTSLTNDPVPTETGQVVRQVPAPVAPAAAPPVAPRSAAVPGQHLPAAATMAVVGALTVLVGAWAGIVPFVGALFGYSADGSPAWTWNLPHALLWLLPGAAAVATGLFVLLLVPHVGTGRARLTSAWAGLIIAACGGWLVFGLSAWPVLNEPRVTIGSGASAFRLLTYQAGWTYGPGLVLVLLGACVLGLAMRRGPAYAQEPVASQGTFGGWTPVT